ncbi:hypothetical protein [Nocardia coubleae]|uniref:Uncharacterized protein n=1 Tax=Nocardia coubleae TaxID=356147 RepID=A0A846WEG7_9NOCA|nr:hypothetical protein [Nocardia coubleae]NKX90977.1 hypothetical protein [Nocardia coubleae]
MPDTVTITPVESGWVVRVPSGAEAVVDDLRSAAFDAARLMDPDRWYEIGQELVLVDAGGARVHAFTLFFDWSNDEAQVRAISENPPPGCRWYAEGSGLHCLRTGSTRFDAIADIAGELRRKHRLAVDFGYEKDEWDNDPDRIAHLLLNAVNRAGSSGIDEHQLLRFITLTLGGAVGTMMETGEAFTSYRLPV